MNHEQLWKDGISHEMEFWGGWKKRGRDTACKQLRPLKQSLASILSKDATEILDVGCGAVSNLGRDVDGREIKIIQADPLSQWYSTLVKDVPNEVHCVGGEDLDEYFSPRKFDLVHASNSVDHSIDPEAVLRGMAAVARGSIFLEHYQNCAVQNEWRGMHQWNFDDWSGRVYIWSKDRQWQGTEKLPIDVAETLGVKKWNYHFIQLKKHRLLVFQGSVAGPEVAP